MRVSVTDVETGDRPQSLLSLGSEDKPALGVAGKVTRIIDAFRDGDEFLMLDDIIRTTGFPRSTSFRILRQLISDGWIDHDARGYSIGPGLSALTADPTRNGRLRTAAGGPLNALHAFTGAVVHLVVLDGGLVHYLDKIGGKVAPSIPSCVGARIPASGSVSGMALLSHLSGEEIERRLRRYITQAELMTVQADALRIRQQRMPFAYMENFVPYKITSMAVPVLVEGEAVAAISLASRVPLSRAESFPPLRRAAKHIADSFGRMRGAPA